MPPSLCRTSPHFLPFSSHLSPVFHSRLFFSSTSILLPLLPLQPSTCMCVCVCVPVLLLLPDTVDSPVWKEAFIGAQSSALNKDNKIQMCPGT